MRRPAASSRRAAASSPAATGAAGATSARSPSTIGFAGATRSLLVLVLALGVAVAAAANVGGGKGMLLTAEILLPIGVVALTLAHLAAGAASRRGLGRRFDLGLAIALGQLLLAVVIAAIVMYVSNHDAWVTIGIVMFAALIASRAMRLLSAGVLADVRAIRDGLRAVERGSRDVRVAASSSAELAELADVANRMISSLQAEERSRDAADAARRQVIAAVSHDLRTPLTSLRLLADALGDELVDGDTQQRYIETMGANVRALGTLVDDLFELSRLEAGDYAWTTEAVPLAELVEEAVLAMRAEAERRGVMLCSEVRSDLAPALANPEKLQRALRNLLQNAIRHTPPDGSVQVRAERLGGSVEVEIADTGEGIAAADRPRVFEPFYRGGEEAARTGAGSGLGLAICRAIVEAHGGRIWLAEAVEGTRVRFTLPLAAG
ncbi:MAG TPA: HAMP domain-containing sensor histidine kinase [Solirubrobacteraceae bacterium]|jgi:signal transduction histidine kinase